MWTRQICSNYEEEQSAEKEVIKIPGPHYHSTITASRWRIGSGILFFVKAPNAPSEHCYYIFRVEELGNKTDLITHYVIEGEERKWYYPQEAFELGEMIGHTEEQVWAAMLIADYFYLQLGFNEIATISDDDYERWHRLAEKCYSLASRTKSSDLINE